VLLGLMLSGAQESPTTGADKGAIHGTAPDQKHAAVPDAQVVLTAPLGREACNPSR